MLKDYCGIIQSVDTESNIITPEIGKLYFINDTGEVKGDLGNGFMKYTKTPRFGRNKTLVAALEKNSLVGTKVYTSRSTFFNYTILEDGFYDIRSQFCFSNPGGSSVNWVSMIIEVGVCWFGDIDSIREVMVKTPPLFLLKGFEIKFIHEAYKEMDITYSVNEIWKYETINI